MSKFFIKDQLSTYLAYLKSIPLALLLFGYLLFSVLTKVLFDIDIMIPCVYSKITGHKCLGCGMNRAAMEACKLNFEKAWSYNQLFFIFISIIIAIHIFDFLRFNKKKQWTKNNYKTS